MPTSMRCTMQLSLHLAVQQGERSNLVKKMTILVSVTVAKIDGR